MKESSKPIWGWNMPLLEVNDLSVGYGEILALRGVNLRVDEGEIVSVVGSNGAGKTTLLRTISGLLTPKSGEIFFLGQKISGIPCHEIVKLGLSQVLEGHQIFPHMSVLDNLRVGAHNMEARKNRHQSLKMVFELFPILEERKKQLARTLSGGERQMLAMGRGLMATPKLLMLDEPSLGLSPLLGQRVFEAIQQINKQGVTLLLVEQNVQKALTLAQRGYVLENGRTVMEGAGNDLLQKKELKEAYLGI